MTTVMTTVAGARPLPSPCMISCRGARLVLAAAAVISLGGCAIAGGAGGTRETLPPLPPPGGVLVNKPPLPEPRPVVVEQPTETAPPLDDDANPASVAGRFLAAVRDGNDGAANALVLPGRDPGVFGWARETFENYTSVQGPDSWGSPSCAVAGDTPFAACTWLAGNDEYALVLERDDTRWAVSHPRQGIVTADTPVLTNDACIAGDDPVNFRGGPGRSWPRFTQLQPGTCRIRAYEVTQSVDGDTWRLIESDGQLGWVVQRVLRGLS